MIDLFEYASKHGVSIEIIPEDNIQYTYRIKVKKYVTFDGRTDLYQVQQSVCFDMLHDNKEDAVEWILDKLITTLNNKSYLQEVKSNREQNN